MPQHLLRNRHADLLGGFKIDHELEFRWLLDGQLGAPGVARKKTLS